MKHRLGFGKDGGVFSTSAASAVKAFERRDAFGCELACYLRLRKLGVDQVLGHHVPQLLDWDEELVVIEMTFVGAPFLLDFAGVRLDKPCDFPPEVMEQWAEETREKFGERWPDVVAILDALTRYGIYMLDVHPGNVKFGENAD